MAIFLFSIFAMFAVFSWAGISTPVDLESSTAKPAAALQEARDRANEQLARTRKQLAEPDRSAESRAELARDVAETERELKGLGIAAAAIPADAREETVDVHTGWATLDHGVEKWRKNPSLMLYKLQSSSYKFSWLLIPLSLPFLWLLFAWRREYKLYDHTVFITYSIAFMSLFFIAVTVIAASGLGGGWLGLAAFVVPFVHITRQLKQAYALRWRWAVLRAVVLSGFIWVVLVLFALVLLALGLFG
jgi:hypothetical protein